MEGGKEEWKVIVYLIRLQRACRRPLARGSFYLLLRILLGETSFLNWFGLC